MSTHERDEPRARPEGGDDRDPGEVPAGGPEPGKAEHVDAGREDTSPGYDIQARFFGAVGTFVGAISVFYGFLSREYAGTTFLALTSLLAFLIAGYMGWHQPRGTPVTEPEPEPEHDDEADWFPESSIWPFVMGAALALVGNGLLLGRWLLLPSLVFLAWALAGFTRQTRWRE